MEKPTITRQQLTVSLNSDAKPDEKGWNIYHYLKATGAQGLSSTDYRALLLEYLRLPTTRPSLLHSMMLALALKCAETYPDFRLPGFVEMWGVDFLRKDDFERRHDDKGRTFHSLAERLGASLLRYFAQHADDVADDAIMRLALQQGEKLGFLPPQPMAAVKMFESEHDGRKVRMVKLVGADGTELSTDWRIFRTKPWEIVGRIYQVLPRRAEKSGNVRVDAIGVATASAADVFGSVTGFVDSYDEKHKHYHIFDNTSRHFVAEAPQLRPRVGDYVRFAPVVPAVDAFKSAIVLSMETKDAGREAFGPVNATVEYVNTEKGYFAYIIPGQPRAFAKLKAATRPLKPGDTVSLIIYERRGPDGVKRPFVAEAF